MFVLIEAHTLSLTNEFYILYSATVLTNNGSNHF